MLDEVSQPIKLFFCYARKDQALRDELAAHLTTFRRTGQITDWYDGEIIPGSQWEDEIEAQLNAANIILLLLSPDFMNSEYIYSQEMKRALERHRTREASVIPILLRPVYREGTPLSRLQMLPSNDKAIFSSGWANKDEAFEDVVKGISRVINNLRTQRVSESRLREVPATPAEPSSRPFPQKLRIAHRTPLVRGKMILSASIVAVIIIISVIAIYFFAGKTTPTTSTSLFLSSATATAAVETYSKSVGANGAMFGFDNQHSHANLYEHILSTTTVKRLQPLEPKMTEGAIEAAPVAANSQVYAVSKGHNLYVFSENGNSAAIWIARIKASISTVPIVLGSTVYVSDESGILHAFPANGCGDFICEDEWSVPYGESSGASPTIANGIIYVASHNNKLSAIRVSDHRILWTGQTGADDISTSPAVYQGMVYASVNSGNLYAFKADGCGQPKCTAQWMASFAESDTTGSSPTISGSDGLVYIGTEGSGVNLFAFPAAGCGQLKCSPTWKASLDSAIGASPAVANGMLYVVSEKGTLFVFKSGGCGQLVCAPLWKAMLKRDVGNSPTVANGVVYISSDDGHLTAFDANGCGNSKKDCAPIVDIQVSNASLTSPTIANGIIYIGSSDSKLYAYRSAQKI